MKTMEKKTIKLSKSDWLRVGHKLGYLSKSAHYFSFEGVIISACSELKETLENHPSGVPTHLTAEHAQMFREAVDEILDTLGGACACGATDCRYCRQSEKDIARGWVSGRPKSDDELYEL
jgi:hypothetical protein